MAKYAARIGRIVANAFLIGHAILGCLDEILRGSDKTDDREQAEGHGKVSAIFVVSAQHLTKVGANALGDVARAAATAAAILRVLNHLNTKYDGIDHLDHSLGYISLATHRHGACAEITRALARLEDADVALAAVQHDLLFKHRNPLEFLCSAVDASLKHQLVIKANGYGIKTTIELHGLNVDIGPANLCALDAHVRGMLNDLLSVIGQIHAYVFKAIAIPAGIQDSVGFNTNSFLRMAGIACKSVIRHSNTSVV